MFNWVGRTEYLSVALNITHAQESLDTTYSHHSCWASPESPINASAEDLQGNPEVLRPMSAASQVALPSGTSKTMGGAVRAIAKSRMRVFATGPGPQTPRLYTLPGGLPRRSATSR